MNINQQQPAVRAGYETLSSVLDDAINQAQAGKGHERHAQGQPFEVQPMQKLIALYGQGFALGQAAKKAQESQRLPYERARAELLGAINYIAGAVIALDMQNKPTVALSFPVIQDPARPVDAPAWATREGEAGIGRCSIWASSIEYAYKSNPTQRFNIGSVGAMSHSEIIITAKFPANDNTPKK